MKRILMIAAFTSCLLISAAALSFADTDEAYRQKQLEQSPDYYSEENQKEIAELQKKVDDYMYLKKQPEQSPEYYSEENQKEIAELQEKVKQYLANDISIKVTSQILDITMYKQENKYYCGPATAQMAIYFGNSTLYSQSKLANYMNTISADGTYVYQMRRGINNYWPKGNYKEVTTSGMAFKNGLIYSIDKRRPVPCHVMTGRLPGYNGHSVGHYVLARGYDSGKNRVYYIDPHYDDAYYGRHYCLYTTMTNAINDNAGYYIMAN